jgi:hypothetical protein
MEYLIAEVSIRVKGNVSDKQVDIIGDVLDSIDFESIVNQKLAEKGMTSVKVEVES